MAESWGHKIELVNATQAVATFDAGDTVMITVKKDTIEIVTQGGAMRIIPKTTTSVTIGADPWSD